VVGQGDRHFLAGRGLEASAITEVELEGGGEPLPSLDSTVAVKVCGSPTRLVPDSSIAIRASTQVLVAGSLLPAAPSVERSTVSPPRESDVCAATTVTPAVSEVIVVSHEPVPPAVVHCVGGMGVDEPNR
jgi:hypothetical protein